MNYTVIWNEAPVATIDAAIESASPVERQAIVRAVEAQVESLRESPLDAGESRQDLLTRVHSHRPVTVHYRVIDRLQIVRVFAARVYRRIV